MPFIFLLFPISNEVNKEWKSDIIQIEEKAEYRLS